MKIRTILPVMLLVASASAFAQLPKLNSDLKKAAQYVTRANSALDKATSIMDKSAENNGGQIIDSAIQSATNQVNDAKELLDKCKELLDGVSSSEIGKSVVQGDYDKAVERHENVLKRLSGAKDVVKDADANMTAGAQADTLVVEALTEEMKKLSADSRADEPDLSRIDRWPQIKKDIEKLLEKYTQTKGSRGENREFVGKVYGLKGPYSMFVSDLKTSIPNKQIDSIKGGMETLRGQLKAASETDLYSKFRTVIPSMVKVLENRCHVFTALCKDNPLYQPGLLEEVKKLKQECKEAAAKREADIINSNEPPTDGYTGGDRDALVSAVKSAFQKANPSAKIVKVILEDPTWTRFISWKWSSSLAWYKEDITTLDAYVVIAGEKKEHVYIWATPLVKDNLQGGTMRVIAAKGLGKPEDPAGVYLANKLK